MKSMTIRRGAAAICLGAVSTAMVGVSGASAEPSDPGPNQADYWEAQLVERGYTGVECEKFDKEGPFTVPEGTWALLVLKAGSGDDAHAEIPDPSGEYVMHPNGKDISHAILCSGEKPTDEPTDEPDDSDDEPDDSEEPTTPPTDEPDEPTDEPDDSDEPTTPAPKQPGPGQPGPQRPDVVQTDGGAMGSDALLPLGALFAGAALAGGYAVRRSFAAARD